MTSPAPSSSPSHGASDVTVTEWLQPEPELVEAVRRGVEAHIARMNCPNCNPTARAYARVQAQWVVAGIDKGE